MRFSPNHRLVLLSLANLALLRPRVCSAINPQAISVPFGPNFLGYDGLWSPVQIRVGSPEQYLLVFPSTTSSETWVAGLGLCSDPTCASRRGGIFYTANSTTWRGLGQYELGYSALTETTPVGDYGFDDIAISDTLTAVNQIIAVVDDVQQWNGQLGLGVVETRFTNDTNYLPFISTLVQNNSAIPSHSYSYTAGASYKGSGIAGSLILGGADTSRYVPNKMWFDLTDGNHPSVAMLSMQISASTQSVNWTANPLQLLPQTQAAMFTIDSSTPYLWLPESVCDNIAQALSLTWDPNLELYLLDSGSVQDRVDMGLEFTFNFAKSISSTDTLALKVSYDAFNLQLSYPYPGLSSNYSDEKLNYFPLRRANNTLQYTLGRAFLQEIYLLVSYESSVFSLSQALFPDSNQSPEIAQIPRPPNSNWPGPAGYNKSASLSIGAKVGIAIVAILAICIIVAVIWLHNARKRQRVSKNYGANRHKNSILSLLPIRSTRKSSVSTIAAELNADKVFPTEMISDASTSRFELSATEPVEMAAGDVAPAFFSQRVNAVIPQLNDPRTPVELVQPPYHDSSSRAARITLTDNNNHAAVPAHTSEAIDQHYSRSDSSSSNAISPYSARRSPDPFAGSDHLVSPIAGNTSDQDRFSKGNSSHSTSESGKYLSPMPSARAQGGEHGSLQTNGQEAFSESNFSSTNRSALYPIADAAPVTGRSAITGSQFREDLGYEGEAQDVEDHSWHIDSGRFNSRKESRFSWET